MELTKQNRMLNMQARQWVVTIALVSFGMAAWAHNGATGIVKERMDGMSAMSKVVKDLTPIMRGQADYDAEQVRAAADVMIQHSGEQMTRLFPEGTGGMPSAAKPTVWENWEGFSELAEQLRLSAEGMKLAADNGLAKDQPQQGSAMMGANAGAMMGSGTGDMMGGSAMGGSNMMTPEMFAGMPVDTAFAAVAQSCSACHQSFRAKEH
jgi:cytochrome c556